MALPTFQYKPLYRSEREIRLVRIKPGRESDHIQCELKYQLLGDQAHFCLSYTWGDEQFQRTVFLDDATFIVRQNLYNFLHTARRYGFRQWIWIDAMCIDQTNYRERAHQVAMMGEIYRSAKSVVTWLAFRDDQARRLHQLGKTLKGLSSKTCRDTNDWVGIADDRKVGHAFEDTITSLIRSDYWTRVWIVQEILLAKNVSMLAPDGIVPFRLILLRLSSSILVESNYLRSQHMNDIVEAIPKMPVPRTNSGIVPGYTTRTAIQLMHSRECSVARDRIYAISAFARNGSLLVINYGSSDEDVLWSTVKSMRIPANFDCQNAWKVYDVFAEAFLALRLKPPVVNKETNSVTDSWLMENFYALTSTAHWVRKPSMRRRAARSLGFDREREPTSKPHDYWYIILPFARPKWNLLLKGTLCAPKPLPDEDHWTIDCRMSNWYFQYAGPAGNGPWQKGTAKFSSRHGQTTIGNADFTESALASTVSLQIANVGERHYVQYLKRRGFGYTSKVYGDDEGETARLLKLPVRNQPPRNVTIWLFNHAPALWQCQLVARKSVYRISRWLDR